MEEVEAASGRAEGSSRTTPQGEECPATLNDAYHVDVSLPLYNSLLTTPAKESSTKADLAGDDDNLLSAPDTVN